MTEGGRRRDGVLLVGQGPPARGGIPSAISTILGDDELARRVRFRFLNTTHEPTRPGAATLRNAWTAVEDLGRVLSRARSARVVHLHLAPAPLLPLLRAIALTGAARLGGAAVIVHAHSGRLHRAAATSGAYRAALRLLTRIADRIVVVSADGADAIRRAGGDPLLLENAVDVEAFAGEPRTNTRVVFVGTVCERKGLDDLRRALLIMRSDGGRGMPEDVAIVGDGRQEGPGVFEHVRDAYAASGLVPPARFTGSLPTDGVRSELASASVFCLPSHWEGLPISLLEAMAAGCAIVASRVGEIPSVVGDAGVVVDPHDPESLAAALRELLTDDARIQALGEAARERVRDRYGIASFRERLLALYAELGYSM